MINREITYKRDMNHSYLIIPSVSEDSFDEKILLKSKIGNLLPIKKCYVATMGQYWYDITGKQALDSYCRYQGIGRELLEKLLLKLCQIVEQLEWNLVDVNCLVLDPEMVFLSVNADEMAFMAYPFHKGELATELQQLLEYILPKLNHKDPVAVEWAYKLYDMVLSDGISVAEIKHLIQTEQNRRISIAVDPKPPEALSEESEPMSEMESMIVKWKEKFETIRKQVLNIFLPVVTREELQVVYPEDVEAQEREQITIHPTICIAKAQSSGMVLRAEKRGVYPDFSLEEGAYIIGKNAKVQLCIAKDTISQFHARIEFQGGDYYIEDLNSTNGTYVNEHLLIYKTRRALQEGDRIRFADVEYQFSS